MKLLFVIDSLNSGGAQRQMVNLANGLTLRDYRVDFFIYHQNNFYKDIINKDIKIYQYPKKRRFAIDVLFNLIYIIKLNKYDLVLSFLKIPSLYSELVHTIIGSPILVASERSCDVPGKISIQSILMQQCHRFADFITVNSHHRRITLENKLPWIRTKIITIYNGVDINKFRPNPSIDFNRKPSNLLVVSSISPYKNGVRLIQALEILRSKYKLSPIIRWAGEHQLQLSNRKKETMEMNNSLKKYNLENQWEWLYQRSDIPEIMRRHDALIHPSYVEGLPNAVCEALSSGLPCLVSNTLDHPKLVEDGKNGFLFEWENAESIAHAIAKFITLKPNKRKLMSINARKFAVNELSMENYLNKYENLINILKKIHT